MFEGLTEEASPEMEDLDLSGVAEAITKFPLIVACAEIDDYVVVSIGLGEHSVGTVGEGEPALANDPGFQFLKDYEADGVLGLLWMEKELVVSARAMQSGAPVWEGIAEGLDASSRLESAPLMAKAVREIGRLAREKEAGSAHDTVGAIILQDGLHLELRGGWHGEAIDLETPLRLAAAFDQWEEQPFLRAHWRTVKSYGDKTLQQIEAGVDVLRLIGEEMSKTIEEQLEEQAERDPDNEQMSRMAELMKTDFLEGVEKAWVGYCDYFREALDSEGALVIDLAGEAPPMIGLDEEVLELGRIPRLAYVRVVKGPGGPRRTWSLWEDAGADLLGVISEAIDTPIPFPDTLSADTNDLRTHFFAMPFATEDFLPSLSVSDKVFVLGTSKGLAAKVDQSLSEEDGEAVAGGVRVSVSMDAFWDFCEAWTDVAEKTLGGHRRAPGRGE